MINLLLATLNRYLGTHYSAAEAIEYLAELRVLPLPDGVAMDDWRVHVPMHLLERWQILTAEVRLAIFVMAHSATHPYEATLGPDCPVMN